MRLPVPELQCYRLQYGLQMYAGAIQHCLDLMRGNAETAAMIAGNNTEE